MRKTVFFLMLPLIATLFGCAGLLLSQRDEDVLSGLKRRLPVSRDEDAVPAVTALATGRKSGSNSFAITEQNRNPEAVRRLRVGTKALEKANWSEAIRSAEAAITLETTFDDAYVIRGLAYLQVGMVDRAIADCGQAVLLNPHDSLAYGCRGMAYEKKDGAADQSGIDLSEAARLMTLINGHVESGDREDRIARLSAVCMSGLTLGCEQHKKLVGRYPSAVQKWLNKRLDESRRGIVAKDWEGVIRSSSDVLRIDQRNVVALCNRAEAYGNKGMLREAAVDSSAAISIDPHSLLAYNSRGWIRELNTQWNDALIDYEAACSRGLKVACANAARLRADQRPR
jgi:tetratricopeptide (TPR) repeat protein